MRLRLVLMGCLCLIISMLILSGPLVAIADSTPEATRSAAPPELTALFAYDESAPLNVTEKSKKVRGDAIVYDITYQSLSNTVQAYLVVPSQPTEAGPGLLFMHGSGGTRSSFLSEATQLASVGMTSLLITEPVRNRPFSNFYLEVDRDKDILRQGIVALRRGLDLLLIDSRTQVDPTRLGYVGFSLGAYDGAILAAVEPRLTVAVLSSPILRINGMAKSLQNTPYGQVMKSFDVVNLVPWSEAALLIQWGRQDTVFGEGDIPAVIAALRDNAKVQLYDGGHGLNDNAVRDRKAWLGQHLRVDVSALIPAPTATPVPS